MDQISGDIRRFWGMCSYHWLSVFIRHVHLSSLAICKTLVGGTLQLAKYQSMTDHIATLPKTILLIDYSNS